MAKKIVTLIIALLVTGLLTACNENSPGTNSVAQAAEPAAGPKGLQKAALTPPAEPRTEAAPSSDGEKYANWKCRLPKSLRDFSCQQNPEKGRTWARYTGGDDKILAWFIANNDDDFAPPGTTHSSEVPVGVWYAARPKNGKW